MRPLRLITLRCPRRCYLGGVVATSAGPQLVMRERALVQTTPARTEARTEEVGPFSLEDPLVSYGCRHTAGLTLTAEHREDLRRILATATRAGAEYVVQDAERR